MIRIAESDMPAWEIAAGKMKAVRWRAPDNMYGRVLGVVSYEGVHECLFRDSALVNYAPGFLYYWASFVRKRLQKAEAFYGTAFSYAWFAYPTDRTHMMVELYTPVHFTFEKAFPVTQKELVDVLVYAYVNRRLQRGTCCFKVWGSTEGKELLSCLW